MALKAMKLAGGASGGQIIPLVCYSQYGYPSTIYLPPETKVVSAKVTQGATSFTIYGSDGSETINPGALNVEVKLNKNITYVTMSASQRIEMRI